MQQRRNPIGCRDYISTHSAALRWWSGSNKDKYEAASTAIVEFEHVDITACVFGSFACKLLGVECKPNDVDLIVLNTTKTLEALKLHLVRAHSQFYLLPSRNLQASYRVLWYKTNRGSRVKVDILQPGVMFVPDFEPSDVIEFFRFKVTVPVAPPGVVLLLKLLGWNERRPSSEKYYNNKQFTDTDHIFELLELLEFDIGIDCSWLPKDFLREAQKCVYAFVYQYPDTKPSWLTLGFRVVRRQRRF